MKRAYEIMGIPHGQLRGDWGIGGGGWRGRLLAGVPVRQRRSRREGLAVQGRADRRRRRRPRRPRARRQRVLGDRGRRQGARDGRAPRSRSPTALYAFAGKIPPAGRVDELSDRDRSAIEVRHTGGSDAEGAHCRSICAAALAAAACQQPAAPAADAPKAAGRGGDAEARASGRPATPRSSPT